MVKVLCTEAGGKIFADLPKPPAAVEEEKEESAPKEDAKEESAPKEDAKEL